MKNLHGFTLIELITVIVVLGILATVAVPLYTDFRARAALANVESVGATISSASYLNWNAKLINDKFQVANNCKDAENLLEWTLATSPNNYKLKPPLGFSYTFGPDAAATNDGQTINCTVTITSDLDPTVSRTASYAYKVTVKPSSTNETDLPPVLFGGNRTE